MTDPEFCAVYTAALRAERDRRGRAVKRRLLGMAGADVSEARIVAEGFVGLPDAVLADLALSPEAIEGLRTVLYDPDAPSPPGAWFFAPDTFPPAIEPAPTAARPAKPARLGRWIGAAVALAASFVLGLVVGPQLVGRPSSPAFALAKLEARGDITRGPDDVQLLVTNDGDARAFVTVVGLGPGIKGGAVYARSGGTFLEAPPHQTASLKGLPREFERATVVVVVLTGVPAADVVLATIPSDATPGQAAALADQLRAALNGYGVKSETRVTTLTTGKP
ncbi:MAG: hypothetical protein U0871_15660 [Gemmataceae bacterium]